MIYLVTTPTCPNCPYAKTLLYERKLKNILIDASKPEGLVFAKQQGFFTVPSILVTDEEDHPLLHISGLEDIISYVNTICVLQDCKE